MTLHTSIRSTGKPTREEIRQVFRKEYPDCKGKKMVDYVVTVDSCSSSMDEYTSYHNVEANWYNIEAVFA